MVSKEYRMKMAETHRRRRTFCERRTAGAIDCKDCMNDKTFFPGLSVREKASMVGIDCPLELNVRKKGAF